VYGKVRSSAHLHLFMINAAKRPNSKHRTSCRDPPENGSLHS
jgi:hypothetical protein